MGKTLIIGQSGGPTSVINASLVGAVKEALRHEEIDKVLGAFHGIDGILNSNYHIFSKNDNLDELITTPAACLGSVRFKLSNDFNDPIYQQILDKLIENNVGYFFYIGGNDSMDTCNKLSEYFKQNNVDIKVIGIPKTIDNDLVHTDHSPGYGSASKYVATTLMEIAQDISVYKKGRVTIVEIMGRDAGWLTASSKLANYYNKNIDLIYLPEVAFDIESFLQKVKEIYSKKQKVLVAVSEGIKDKDDNYILKYRNFNNNDSFGHLQLGGVAEVLAEIVGQKLGYSVRAIELNLPQRCASHIASLTDVKEALNCGKHAVRYALKNKTGVMIGMVRQNGKILYKTIPLSKVANFVKEFPKEWIIDGCDISDEYTKYALPLIQGESMPKFKNGLPIHYKIKD